MGFPLRLQDVKDVFTWMPFLVDLEVHDFDLDREKLLNTIKTCRKFERLQFNLVDDGVLHEQWRIFLKECPATLKSCRGKRHVVLVEDTIDKGEGVWGCVGLKELDIEVLGVPRLTEEQEVLLEALEAEMNVNVDEDVDVVDWHEDSQLERIFGTEQGDEERLIQSRIQQLWRQRQQRRHRRIRTTEEKEALGQRRISYAVQRRVYQRLGWPTQLRKLGFGRQIDTDIPTSNSSDDLLISLNPTFQGHRHLHHYRHLHRQRHQRSDALEFTPAAGLAELNCLVRLKEVWFYGISRQECWIEEEGGQWMTRRWGMVRLYRGSEGVVCLISRSSSKKKK
ncbi:hypothetical protein BGW39_000056 [Mortierella sp. 14UC]|nr:hypothetical protein BGW39_000056 [Mortierella sp. 14UC]